LVSQEDVYTIQDGESNFLVEKKRDEPRPCQMMPRAAAKNDSNPGTNTKGVVRGKALSEKKKRSQRETRFKKYRGEYDTGEFPDIPNEREKSGVIGNGQERKIKDCKAREEKKTGE